MSEIIGRLERTTQRPERLALVRLDGSVSSWFARDMQRDDVATVLARHGLALRDDDSVVRQCADGR